MSEFTIYHDSDALDIMDSVNRLLAKYGLKFEDDGQEHDGYCIYSLCEQRKPAETAPRNNLVGKWHDEGVSQRDQDRPY